MPLLNWSKEHNNRWYIETKQQNILVRTKHFVGSEIQATVRPCVHEDNKELQLHFIPTSTP
jgi:hypothetical protein